MPYKDKQKQKESKHRYYLLTKDKSLERNNIRRRKIRTWFSEYMQDKFCLKCGESDIRCLDFHHINPKDKIGSVAEMVCEMRSINMIIDEIKKCVIWCSN